MSETQKLLIEQIESGKLQIRQTATGALVIESAGGAQEDRIVPAFRTHKDRIFRMIFKNRENFLTLYNALNGTHYTNPDDLTVSTLDSAIYMGMKNDISFVLYDHLLLYEHQSTKSLNMPLRNLFYVSDVYSKLVRDKNIYSSALIRIPEPRFVVFYNGAARMPEQSLLKLSDMYERPSDQPALELVTHVFNINLGFNKELMKNCKALYDYAVFVDLVRRYRKDMPLSTAIAKAINECIAAGVLADFLKANKAEVLKMGIYEYDEEKHIQMEREEAWENGHREGVLEGQQKERQASIKNIVEISQNLGASFKDTVQRLMQQYTFSEDEANEYVKQYWAAS